MRKSEQGFAHVVVLLVAVLLVAGCGYVVYAHQHNKTVVGTTTSSKAGLSSTSNEPNTASGAASSVNNLATSLSNSESALNTQSTASDQTSDANVGAAANNLGGAYDANNY